MIVQWKCILFAVAFTLGWTLNQIENQRIKPASHKQRSFLLQWILPLSLSSFPANMKSCTVIHKRGFVKLQSLLTVTTFLAWDQPTFTSFSLTIILTYSCHLVGKDWMEKSQKLASYFVFYILFDIMNISPSFAEISPGKDQIQQSFNGLKLPLSLPCQLHEPFSVQGCGNLSRRIC